MYDSYLELISAGKATQTNVLRNLDNFITSDPENPNNLKLKKILLLKAQKNPDILWNEILSWLFVQQRQYNSAFNQEKAIYKRSGAFTLQRLIGLGDIALEDNAIEDAEAIFTYIDKNSNDPVIKLNARLSLIDIELLDASAKQLDEVERQFESLMEVYGYENHTLQLQIAYSHFLTFKKGKPEEAIAILKKMFRSPPGTLQ